MSSQIDLNKFVDVPGDRSELIRKITALSESELDEFIEFALAIMGRQRLPGTPTAALIEQVVPRSNADLAGKLQGPLYYHGSLAVFFRVIEQFLSRETIALLESNPSSLAVRNYRDLFVDLLTDAVGLLCEYDRFLGSSSIRGYVSRRSSIHPVNLYHFAKQVIVGQASGHAFADRQPYVSVAIIRQLIELRLREAFGIFSRAPVNQPQSALPIMMRSILDAARPFQSQMDLSVTLPNLDRIYSWTNMFIHYGERATVHIWVPLYVLEYLRHFALGRSTNGYNADHGVVVERTALDGIRHAVARGQNEEEERQWELLGPDPTARIVQTLSER
ncbi:MAG: hypothetical protein O7H41_15360 [Planctomycetota bacterium]|nr:hypothetical protein [Planctomycetota bacterium]